MTLHELAAKYGRSYDDLKEVLAKAKQAVPEEDEALDIEIIRLIDGVYGQKQPAGLRIMSGLVSSVLNFLGLKRDKTICIVGQTGGGKSSLIYVIGHEGPNSIQMDHWIVTGRSAYYRAFCNACKQMIWDEDWRATDPVSRLKVIEGMFTLVSKEPWWRRWSCGKMRIKTFEVSGETWQELFAPSNLVVREKPRGEYSNTAALKHWVAKCDAFIILIDAPLAISSDPRDRERIDTLHRLLGGLFQFMNEEKMLNRPVALVLNKADAVVVSDEKDPLKILEVLRARHSGIAALDAGESLEDYQKKRAKTRTDRRDAAKRFVHNHFPNAIPSQGLTNFEFFAISCWGHAPYREEGSHNVIINRNFRPVCVEEPFSWVFDQLAQIEPPVRPNEDLSAGANIKTPRDLNQLA